MVPFPVIFYPLIMLVVSYLASDYIVRSKQFDTFVMCEHTNRIMEVHFCHVTVVIFIFYLPKMLTVYRSLHDGLSYDNVILMF